MSDRTRPGPPEPSNAPAARYCDVRRLTEVLAAPLGAEDQTVQSMPDVSPTKWHRAHVSWFFEEFVLARAVPDQEPAHPAYRYLFNSYYEAIGERHPRGDRGLLSRPTAAEVSRYREVVDRRVLDVLAADPEPDVLDLVELGLHHEQQHQELLLMDAKHVLSQGPLDTPYRSTTSRPTVDPVPLTWMAHPGGIVEIGHDGDGFAFDNEGPRHRVLLEPFALADRAVTCGEWLAFMDDGGYRRPELWLSEGWATAQQEGWSAPLYWRLDGDTWTTFTLSGRRGVVEAEPVCHVSYFEADAYARWADARLPTEAEWEAVAAEVPVDGALLLDLDELHPRPAQGGLAQLHGDVWEWTSSPYTPYPGFVPEPGAVGEYNGKFMVNQQVLRGGSCVTPFGHLRPTYRNFFPAGARWAFAGLRLARDDRS
jgi:ergothioneine biosynthesis protein EgtB